MPLDETFPAEVADAPVAETPPPAEAPQPPVEAPVEAPEPPVEVPPVVEPPQSAAFNEAEYLKTKFGDDAPETADELKARIESYKANQVTDEIKGQLAVLSDATKLGEYAAIAGKDYDKPAAADVMRERFALEHPDMNPAQAERRFLASFAQKYPTLYAALDPENGIEADDPRLLAEREDADYDAQADRAFLKNNQETFKQEFFAAAAAASTAPQQSPEQIADANSVLKWFDETMSKDNATLPIDLGNGTIVNMPVGDAKSFKDGFLNTDKLYLAQVQTPEGKINKEAQAKIALFLRDPKAYDAYIANAVKSAQPAAIAIDDLTNSSRRQAPAKLAAANPAAPVNTAAWQDSNF